MSAETAGSYCVFQQWFHLLCLNSTVTSYKRVFLLFYVTSVYVLNGVIRTASHKTAFSQKAVLPQADNYNFYVVFQSQTHKLTQRQRLMSRGKHTKLNLTCLFLSVARSNCLCTRDHFCRKTGPMILHTRKQRRHRCKKQAFGLNGRS